MTYKDGEALLLTAIRVHAEFDTGNTSRAKFGILNSGDSSYYVILRPGPFTIESGYLSGIGATDQQDVMTWITQAMLYQRYKDDGTSVVDLATRLEDLIEAIQKYRYLGDTNNVIQGARVVGGGEVEELMMGENGPLWLRWIVNVEWQEERRYTYAE